MKNKILILLLLILFITSGCTKKDKIYLNDEYYNNGDFIVVDNEELDKETGDSQEDKSEKEPVIESDDKDEEKNLSDDGKQ